MLIAIDPKLKLDLGIGFALRALGAIASFALSWLIARHFGASTLGLFQLALVSAGFASILALSGFDVFLIRHLGGTINEQTRSVATRLYARSLRNVLVFAVCLLIALILSASTLTKLLGADPELTRYLYIFSPLVLAIPVIRLSCALLRTGRKVLLSQSLDGVAYTGLTAICLLALIVLDVSYSPLSPAYLYTGGVLLVVMVAVTASRKLLGGFTGFNNPVPAQFSGVVFAAPYLLATANEWLLLSLVTFFEGAASTGVYRASFQIAGLIMLINSSFTTMVGPWLSKAANEGNYRQVATLAHKVGLVGLAMALPFAILVFWKPEFILGLFGSEFTEGATALQTLMLAQLINVAFGPIGAAIVMVDRQKAALVVELFATLLGLTIAVAAMRELGLVGAALGVLAVTITRNSLCALVLHYTTRKKESARADPAAQSR
ncbi:lipopolysaccharide biosynthesis protein [Erythrobacter sp. HA6-11]